MSNSYLHPKFGEGLILAYFEFGQAQFKSNAGIHMVLESDLKPLGLTTPSGLTLKSGMPGGEILTLNLVTEPERELVTAGGRPSSESREEDPREKIDLNQVQEIKDISGAFPRIGKAGAKKLHDRRPESGWVSLDSMRSIVGELFPSEESWKAFCDVFEVV